MSPVPEDPTAREPVDQRDQRDQRDQPDQPEGPAAAHIPGSAATPEDAGDLPDEPEVAAELEVQRDDGVALDQAPGAPGAGTLQVPLSPVAHDRIRWGMVGATLAGAIALLVATAAGYAPTLAVTLVLALAVAWGWPVLSGSFTPNATSTVLAVSSVAIVLGALRDDLRWVAAAVAFGIVLSFAAQLLRRTGREGLVLTLMSSFGGLAVVASGATGVIAANSARGTAVGIVAMSAVVAAVVPDLLAAVRAAAPVLGVLALVAGALAGVIAGWPLDDVGSLTALGIGAAVGTLSWSFRRVLSLEPAMTTLRGQVGAGAGSVVAMGAVVHLFAVLG